MYSVQSYIYHVILFKLCILVILDKNKIHNIIIYNFTIKMLQI